MKIILASKSKARKKILEDCGFRIKVAVANIKESHRLNRSFGSIVKSNALRKAEEVAKRVRDGVIVAADTLVFRKNFVFGKPSNLKEAKRVLRNLSRKPHWIYTGIVVLDKKSGRVEIDCEKTKVFMERLSDKDIKKIFHKSNPLQFAGGFDIQGQGALYIKRIEGCFYNVVGLPLAKLFAMFKKMGLMVLFLIFSMNVSGCTEFNPVTQRQEVILYSTEREVSIGRNISREVEKEYGLAKDPNLIERINKITEKIATVADRRDVNYYVSIIEAKEEEKEDGSNINAFALPGGYIYLYDGLVDFADDDDQLACVIAHEVGHIVAKHSIKKLQAIMGYTLLSIAAVGTQNAEFASGVNYAFFNLLLAYSREDELLADRLGARYAEAAGYDPRAMIDFLEKLREKQKKEPLRARSVYRTHPYFSERITAIKKELGEPLTIRDYVNIAND